MRIFEDHEFREYVINRIERFRQETSWQAVAKKPKREILIY